MYLVIFKNKQRTMNFKILSFFVWMFSCELNILVYKKALQLLQLFIHRIAELGMSCSFTNKIKPD